MEVRLRRLFRAAAAGADRHERRAGAVAPRVAVVGNTGSGKTTLAQRLAAVLGVPHVELDALFWRPNWEMAPTDEFRAEVDEALTRAPDGWVADGNYFGRLGERVLEQADLVVWLDPPLRIILWRLWRRTRRRVRTGEALWGTNRETWRDAFLGSDALFVWALKKHRERGKRATLIARFPHVRLRSQAEAAAWFERFVAR